MSRDSRLKKTGILKELGCLSLSVKQLLYGFGFNYLISKVLALLKKEDVAILDMAVHASVYEGNDF